jgi:subtilisin-like proprotein convertase family protein
MTPFSEILKGPDMLSPANGYVYETDTGYSLITLQWSQLTSDACLNSDNICVDSYHVSVQDSYNHEVFSMEIPHTGAPTAMAELTLPVRSEPYRWMVFAVNEMQQYQSDFREFYVNYGPPQLQVPCDTCPICIDNQTFEWVLQEGVDYRIELYQGETLKYESLVKTNSVTLDPPLLAGDYTWHVLPWMGTRAAGIQSATWTVTILDYPYPNPVAGLVSPTDGFSPYDVVFTWEPTLPDNGYELELYYGECDATDRTLERTEYFDPGVTEYTTTLEPDKALFYSWRLRARPYESLPEGECTPAWSECDDFYVIVCGELDPPALVLDSVCPGVNSEISWDPIPYTLFHPEFSIDGDNWVPATHVDQQAGTAYQLSPFGYAVQTISYAASPNQLITDNGTILSSIYVPEECEVAGAKVKLNITHPWDSDLKISLRAPDLHESALINHRGGAGDNFIDTWLYDLAPDSISDGGAPFTGTYKPDAPLNTFIGHPSKGVWELLVSDTAMGDVGTLNDWQLDVQCRLPGGEPPGFWRLRLENFCGDETTGDPAEFGMIDADPPTFDLSCASGGALELTKQPGYSYVVQFYDVLSEDWLMYDVAMDCVDEGDIYTCASPLISPGSGTGYQWQVQSVSPDGCPAGPLYTEPFGWRPDAVPWDGTGWYIRSAQGGSNPVAGINNQWTIEDICPDVWDDGQTVGTIIFSTDSSFCDAPASPQPQCGGSEVSWFTATVGFYITVPSAHLRVGAAVGSGSGAEDAIHWFFFDTDNPIPAPGPPGDDGAVVVRQFCYSSYTDGFGCGTSNETPFYLPQGCYMLRVTVVDSTGGCCVSFDTDLGNPDVF